MKTIIKTEDALLTSIREVLLNAKQSVVRSVNSTMVHAYWQIGRYIVEYEQQGGNRAEYGSHIMQNIAKKLTAEFGNGFTLTNLKLMRQFYCAFPIGHALRDQLSWTHYRALLKVQNETIRQWYIDECYSENWSARQLERQINTHFYERMLASKDKEAIKQEIKKTEPKPLQSRDIIKDPYILEFLGIPQSEHFLECDLEQYILNKLQNFMLELGKGYSFV